MIDTSHSGNKTDLAFKILIKSVQHLDPNRFEHNLKKKSFQ